MSFTSLVISVFFILSLSVHAQEGRAVIHATSTPQNNELFKKYLGDKSDPEVKITEILTLAQEDSRKGLKSEALQKLQIALVLEKQISQPSPILFDLNLWAGEFVATIYKGYALKYFEKATAVSEKVKDISSFTMAHMFTNRAGIHQYLMQLDSADHYYRKALEFASPYGEASALNNLGYFFSHTGAPDTARYYFEKALLKHGKRESDIGLYCSIIENIAHLDVVNGNYDQALQTYRFNDSVYYAISLTESYVYNKVRLLKVLQLHEPAAVHETIIELQNYIDLPGKKIPDRYLLEFYLFANDFYFNQGDRHNQAFYRKLYRDLNEKLTNESIGQLDQLAQSLLAIQESGFESDIEAYQLRAEKQKLQLRSTRFTAIALVTTAVLIILLLIVYIAKRRLTIKAAQEKAKAVLKAKEMHAQLLEKDLELKKKDLTSVVLHNTHVHDFYKRIIDRLEEISSQRNPEQNIRSLLTELQFQNLVSQRSIELQSNIESINEKFFENLKIKFPNLTKSETELCGFIRINLTNKDVAILKNVAATSVKMSKTRLRKKLGIAPEQDIYSYIKTI